MTPISTHPKPIKPNQTKPTHSIPYNIYKYSKSQQQLQQPKKGIKKPQMQVTTEQKQQYLRLQILQAGYDPDDFIQFMSTYSGIQSSIIEHLTINQLKNVVAEYKEQVGRRKPSEYQPQDTKQQPKPPPEQPTQKLPSKKIFDPQRIRLLQQKKNKIQYDKYGLFDYQLKGSVNCIQSPKIVNLPNISVTVPEIQTKDVQGYLFGFGAKTQYYYHIQSNLMKGTVKRLSQDFDWLNTTLLRLYPYLMVPLPLQQIPQLQPIRKDIKDPHIKRQKQIQQYLQHLCCKKYLVQSYVLIHFLTLSLDKIQKYKKTYDAIIFNKGISKIQISQGLIQIDLSKRTRQLYNCSKQFTRKTSQLHDSISQAISKMIQSYQIAIIDTTSVINLFADLHDAFTQISNKFPNLKKQQYNQTLHNLNNLFVSIGNNIKNIKDNIDIYLKDYYQFYNGLDKNLLKLQRYIKDTQNQYLQYKQNLQRKKQRVINTDPSKWQIDTKQIDKTLNRQQIMKIILPKQTIIQNQLKSWYAFNLKNYQLQFYSYLKFINLRYKSVFQQFALKLLQHSQQYVQAITQFVH